MKRTWRLGGTVLLAALTVGTAAAAQDWKRDDPRVRELRPVPVEPKLIPVPVDPRCGLEIAVWTSAGHGGFVRPGEEVRITFETNRDAFVAVYDVDTRGRVHRIFPRARWEDGWVRGGRRVSIPERWADYRLIATGPSGIERIVAVASDRPLWDDEAIRAACLHGEVHEGTRPGVSYVDGEIDLGAPPVAARGMWDVEPKLVPVPREPRRDLARDEAWFRVETRSGRYR